MLKKRFLITWFVIVFVAGFFQLSSSGISNAAIHYVSPVGSDTWANSTNIATPCSIDTAFTNAAADDIVLFRDGTYSKTSTQPGGDLNAVYGPSKGGTSGHPITFKAYPGETPIIEITWSDTTIVHNALGNVNSMGDTPHHYITFDGFTVRATGNDSAAILIAGWDSGTPSYGCIVQNCTIIGGTNQITTENNHDLLRVDYTDSVTIRRNKIGPLYATGISDNVACLKIYNGNNMLIENNEIFNSRSMGISAKRKLNNSTIRYNWFYGNYQHFRNNAYAGGGETSSNNKIYHNIFYGTASYQTFNINHETGATCSGWEFYNNTVLNTGQGTLYFGASGNTSRTKIYNNILKGKSGNNNLYVDSSGTKTFSEEDHNQWGDSTFSIYWKGTNYSSLASWQASTELEGGGHPGVGDLASNVTFANGSGSLNQSNDFRLASDSPCKGTGRNGADMGANIDFVGVSGRPPSDNSPAAPKGLKIIQ